MVEDYDLLPSENQAQAGGLGADGLVNGVGGAVEIDLFAGAGDGGVEQGTIGEWTFSLWQHHADGIVFAALRAVNGYGPGGLVVGQA